MAKSIHFACGIVSAILIAIIDGKSDNQNWNIGYDPRETPVLWLPVLDSGLIQPTPEEVGTGPVPSPPRGIKYKHRHTPRLFRGW